jgi:glyoxylase-like metal-dependent hydrolase (beta-lactamase superfamily II)
MVHVGGDHAPDASIAYVPEDRVMFLGDCMYEDIYHGPNRYTTGTLFPLLDRLLEYDAEIYFPGHHPEPLSRAQLAEEAKLLKAIGGAVETRGQDRAAILAALPGLLGRAVDEDATALVDAFLAGLRLPVVESVW